MSTKVGMQRDEEAIMSLCDEVRETAFSLHRFLRHGLLEKVYENGLANRLRTGGHIVEQQKSLQVRDADGTVLGDYYADLFVDGRLIVELKVCKGITDEHLGQVLGYLRASGERDAMLINFGTPKLQVRKLVL